MKTVGEVETDYRFNVGVMVLDRDEKVVTDEEVLRSLSGLYIN